jgi:hypothetical protein
MGSMPSPLDLQASVYAGSVPHASHAQRLPKLPLLLSVFPFVFGAICMACGAVGSSSPPLPPSITVQPNSAQPYTGGNVQFSATVQNVGSSAVTWQVNQIPGGNATVGIINSTGHYVAPNSVPNPSTVTVTAVSQADPTLTGSAIVTIQSPSSIQGLLTLSPALASVTTSQTLQLKVLTAGVTSTDVNWAVDSVANGSATVGTISVSGNFGLYTPGTAAGAHLVTATLIANPSAIGTATVEVTDFPGTLTWRNDNSRSGVNNRELALSPATVSSSTFGKLFSCPIDGYAYAEPLYVPNLMIPGDKTRNVVFVATEKDLVYAFDADASPCVQLWKATLIPAGSEAVPTPNTDITSTDIVPFVGITGTPVVSLSASALYVVAKTTAPSISSGTATYTQQLYALNLATGQQTQSVVIQVPAPSPQLSFSALSENQRAALLLDNGTVYIAFASHGGEGDYHGWLLAYDSTNLTSAPSPTAILNVTPNGSQGGIWQSGGGPSVDASHNLFLSTGEGPPNFGGGPPATGASYDDTFLRLGTSLGTNGGGLSVADYFTPCDQEQSTPVNADASVHSASSALVLLPDAAGSASEPHLMVGATKEGFLYVLNRDNLGWFDSTCLTDSPPRVQAVPVGDGPILSTPLFWNNAVYVAAANGKLKSFALTGGNLASSPNPSQSPETLGPQGATPVISSNGTSNAILWLIDASGALTTPPTPNGPAILRAFDPNNLSNEIYNSGMVPTRVTPGLAVKFTVPTVANGKVYVGTQTELDVYGLLQ